MMPNKKLQLIAEIKRLSNELDNKYCNELNFRNHCYLRIAYDATIKDKWDNVIMKLFVKFATIPQLLTAIEKLNNYKIDKVILLSDNEKSLAFRSKSKKKHKEISLQLF
jgi:hypothetical protein